MIAFVFDADSADFPYTLNSQDRVLSVLSDEAPVTLGGGDFYVNGADERRVFVQAMETEGIVLHAVPDSLTFTVFRRNVYVVVVTGLAVADAKAACGRLRSTPDSCFVGGLDLSHSHELRALVLAKVGLPRLQRTGAVLILYADPFDSPVTATMEERPDLSYWRDRGGFEDIRVVPARGWPPEDTEAA